MSLRRRAGDLQPRCRTGSSHFVSLSRADCRLRRGSRAAMSWSVRDCSTSMISDYLVQYGDVIAYALVGALALIGLGVIQLLRRRRDVKRARIAVRLASYSISEPRQGPIAVSGSYWQNPT